jgi:hypothetical protein
MLVKNVYTIYDSKAEAYLTPWFVDKDGQALREFQDAVQNPEAPFNKHPEDYTLFKIGKYDITTGKLEALETPVSMGLAIEYIQTGLSEVINQ